VISLITGAGPLIVARFDTQFGMIFLTYFRLITILLGPIAKIQPSNNSLTSPLGSISAESSNGFILSQSSFALISFGGSGAGIDPILRGQMI
jgi:hypothetical protein